MSETASRHTNRLIEATSPYLIQHAHNPVDWYPWGEEALSRARAEDKPILLSIGYSACHWCHVMAHESFEDEAIAERMNRHFVCVKVDREERPDLDDIYMAATLAINQGQGGWPMTVFLTPEQEPFFAGTYFPPTDRWGRPGFATLLERIAELWRSDRSALCDQAALIVDHLRDQARPAPGPEVGRPEIGEAVRQLGDSFDPHFGGFGPAPKFPPTGALLLLLREHSRTGDEGAARMARRTLDAMARGGMYDQIGGGFCRYSVDERWLVPHFEKMLYDNALLARVYLEAHQALGDGFYRRIAVEVLDYVLAEMASPEGGFFSATDADSEGEEGKFFVWMPAQVEAVLGAEAARRFCAFYDITEHGNWEGRSIPNTPLPISEVARRLGVDEVELAEELQRSRRMLYEARLRRVPPGLDDKVLTAWNGLMIGALAEGHRVLRDRRYLEAAARAADFVLSRLRSDEGRLLRSFRAGRAHLDGYLEDHAFLADGLIDLYEAGGETRYLDEALALSEQARSRFASPDGGFFSTGSGHEKLILRHREGHDGAVPNANAIVVQVLLRLSRHLGRPELAAEAERALGSYAQAIHQQPRAFVRSLLVVDSLLEGPVELVLVGAVADEAYQALAGELSRHHLPNRIVAHHDPLRGEATHPLLVGKPLVDGRPALYVCRDFACRAPVTTPAEVEAALSAVRRSAS